MEREREMEPNGSSNCMSLQNILKNILTFLKETAVFTSFSLSLLLIGVKMLIKPLLSCPCNAEANLLLTVFIFTGPALFILTLIYFVLRPCRHESNCSCAERNDDTQLNCLNGSILCLIPLVMWIIILLLDGDYVACGKTDWKGVYVYDEELNRSWCKPTEGTQNETKLRDRTRKYIHQSQIIGYIIISVGSVILFSFACICDCCKSGKCRCCPTCCGQTGGERNEDQVGPPRVDTAGQEPQGLGNSASAGQEPQGSGNSASAGQEPQGLGNSATAEQEP